MTDPVIPASDPVVASLDIVRGVIRTAVPYVIGILVTWLGSKGVDLPKDTQAQLATVITVVIGSVWYTVSRKLEKINPAFGWLLGAPGAPVYLPAGQAVPSEVNVSTTPVNPGV